MNLEFRPQFGQSARVTPRVLGWISRSIRLFVLSAFFWMSGTARSHATTLSAGDILFTGYISNATTYEAFSFVLLVDISGTTVINFTDNAWLATNALRTGEQTVTWTYTGALTAGREIIISGTAAGAATAVLAGAGTTLGTCTGLMPALATAGDQVIAYIGTASAPTPIAGIHANVITTPTDCGNTTNTTWDPACFTASANFSIMPLGLSAGVSAVWIGTEGLAASEQDNAIFNCIGPLLTVAEVRASLTNSANWTSSSLTPPAFTLPSGCNFLTAPLPLNLLSFDGSRAGTAVSLQWKTSQEMHHAYFRIERSLDGRNFQPIARVEAQGGFSYLPFDYSFRDLAPLQGANFYRLSMVSIERNVTYSSVVKVMMGSAGRTCWISPNPASSEVVVFTPAHGFTQVTISNMAGAVIQKVRINAVQQKLDLRHLAPGQYVIRVSGVSESFTEKLIIAR